jgi:thiol:disulfide interchange protein DsbD
MRILLTCLCLFFLTTASASHEPLPVDQVFKPTVNVVKFNELRVSWQLIPHVSLYKKSLRFQVLPKNTVTLAPRFPKTDSEKLGPDGHPERVYKHNFNIPIRLSDFAGDSFTLLVNYQGCEDSGVCYPPQSKRFAVNLSPPYGNLIYPQDNKPAHLKTQFADHSWFWTLGSYFMLGLLLAFTPCVLPMVPIVAGIVMGEHTNHRSRGLLLALCYVLGMALAYAIAGVVVTRLGVNLQAFWQQPWLIAIFAGVFVLMALALFDLYQIQLPSRLQNKMNTLSNNQQSGKFWGAFVMGILSSLILSPCITPALVGALAYIVQTGDWALGGSSLFFMGIGMGVPLLIIGFLGQQVLRRFGPWLGAVKATLGILMLAISIGLLSRILPNWITQLLWGAIFIGAGSALFAVRAWLHHPWKSIKKAVGTLLVLYGAALWGQMLIIDHSGSLPVLRLSQTHAQDIQTVDTPKALKAALVAAGNKPVLLEFSAKWCLACQVMEERVFPQPDVQQALEPFVQLRVDLTQATAGKEAIMRKYRIIAPPVMVFLRKQKELPDARLVGEVDATKLVTVLGTVNARK